MGRGEFHLAGFGVARNLDAGNLARQRDHAADLAGIVHTISCRVICNADTGLTNNKAEVLGIMWAVDLAEAGDIIVSDFRIALGWVRRDRSKARADLNDGLRPSSLATLPPWKPCCLIAGLRHIPSAGWNSAKNNPTKPRFVAAGNEPPAALPLSRQW